MSFLKNVIKPIIPSKFWNDLRKKQILSKHKKVADLWNPIINDYLGPSGHSLHQRLFGNIGDRDWMQITCQR